MTWGRVSILVFLAIALSACVQPVKTVRYPLMADGGVTQSDIASAINKAGRLQGWEMTAVSEGTYYATWRHGRHIIMVELSFNTESFRIKYKDSVNMKYDGTSIHRRYNQEVEFLAGRIQSITRFMVPSSTVAKAPRARSAPIEVSSGTGFVVSAKNEILTNNHVVQDCRNITADGAPALLIAGDKINDLALLRVGSDVVLGDGPASGSFAQFRSTPRLRKGEDVILAGYPYGSALSSEMKLTAGIVNALSGLNDDRRKFQISAPAQPGSSGGPAFDRSGLVIGVLSSGLDDLGAIVATGAVPQNVNFAIGLDMVRSFLASEDVAFTEISSETDLPSYVIAEQAQGFTVKIDCQS